MKKYLPIIFTVLIIPSVTFAAWWNPISWFGSNDVKDQQPIQQIVIPENQQADQQQSSSTESLSPVANIDIATSTTSVQTNSSQINDQSQLKAQINLLTAQNNLLKSKLAIAGNQLAVVQNNYAMCQTNLTTAQNSLTSTQIQAQQPNVVPPVSINKPASATILLDDSTPVSTSVSTSNGQYLDLPVLTLDIRPSSSDQALDSLTVNINSSGSGIINTATLFTNRYSQTPIATAIVSNGSATFSLTNNAYSSLSNMNYPYNVFTIKLNLSGLGDKGSSQSVSASVSNVKVVDSKGRGVDITGNAQGNIITVNETSATVTPGSTLPSSKGM